MTSNESTDVSYPEVIGSHETSVLLGISKTRLFELVDQGAMPPPASVRASNRRYLWITQDVIDWALARGRTIHLNAISNTP